MRTQTNKSPTNSNSNTNNNFKQATQTTLPLPTVPSTLPTMSYLPLTKRDDHFVNVAYNASHDSNMLMKHGACVVENNRVIGVGCNSTRTQFKDKFIGVSCSCHAEMSALRDALKHKNSRALRNRKSQVVLRSKGT